MAGKENLGILWLVKILSRFISNNAQEHFWKLAGKKKNKTTTTICMRTLNPWENFLKEQNKKIKCSYIKRSLLPLFWFNRSWIGTVRVVVIIRGSLKFQKDWFKYNYINSDVQLGLRITGSGLLSETLSRLSWPAGARDSMSSSPPREDKLRAHLLEVSCCHLP